MKIIQSLLCSFTFLQPKLLLPARFSTEFIRKPSPTAIFFSINPSPPPSPSPTPLPSPPPSFPPRRPPITSMLGRFLSGVFSIPAIQLGFPLTFFTALFTYHHYGHWVLQPLDVFIEFLIGFYTYGSDRLYDAILYDKTNRYRQHIPEEKKRLYEYILKNRDFYSDLFRKTFYFLVVLLLNQVGGIQIFDSIACLVLYEVTKWTALIGGYHFSEISIVSMLVLGLTILQNHLAPLFSFILLLDSTNLYISLKKFPLVKPLYVATMWTIATALLPFFLHEGNLDILWNQPKDVWEPFLFMLGLTNFADVYDIDSDRQNGYQTMPVVWGVLPTVVISVLSWTAFWLLVIL